MKYLLTAGLFLCLGATAFSQFETTVQNTNTGYIFDVSLKSNSNIELEKENISGARIEVYNNTLDEETMLIENHQSSNFQVNMEKGNHYSILVRKEGYFNKRMEAYVDIEGCILCFKGVGNVQPNVTDAMTENQESGALLAEVMMDKIELNKIIKIENIYYDLDKWDIRKDAARELDNVITVLKDHPGMTMELGSHTDARGRDEYNLELSEKRAASAVQYIVEKGGINPDRITGKGYGETQLTNGCKNGVTCSERSHEKNRRTVLKVTGYLQPEVISYRSLKEIVMEEQISGIQTMSAKKN